MYSPTYKHGKLHKINADEPPYCIQIYRNCIKYTEMTVQKDVINASKS